MRNTILAVAAVVTALFVPGASHAFWPFDGLGDAVAALVTPKSVTEGGVTKTRLGSLRPDDRVVTDMDLSHAVNTEISAYDRTNLTARIDEKADAETVAAEIEELLADIQANAGRIDEVQTFSSNVWITLDSYIDYIQHVTNNYLAARLANYRALRLETWQLAVSNQLILANAKASELKSSRYFSADNRQLVSTIEGTALPRSGGVVSGNVFITGPTGSVRVAELRVSPYGKASKKRFGVSVSEDESIAGVFGKGIRGTEGVSINSRGKISVYKDGNTRAKILTIPNASGTLAVSEQERAYVDSRFGEIRPVSKYLKIIDFADTFDAEAKRYEAYADEHGYCSSVSQGGIYASNYDGKKTGAMTYVGRLSSSSNRYASIFTCNVGTNLTDKLEAECGWTWFHRALPGHAVDGLNEKGVCCNISVVTYEPSRGAAWDLAQDETGRDLNLTMACRYVLDHFATAAEAAAYVAAHGYSPKVLRDQGFSIHMMIADERETWVVEDAVAVNLTAAGLPAVMTNFRVRDPEGDLYGSGYERYDLLVAGGPDAIQAAWFTGAYRTGADGEFVRPTELAGKLVATNAAGEVVQILSESGVSPNEYKLPHTDLVRLRQACKLVIPDGPAESFPRDGSSCQTVHSAVYDISNRCMRIAVQETPDWHVVSIPQAGLDEQRVVNVVDSMGSFRLYDPVRNKWYRLKVVDGTMTLEQE